MKKIIYILLPFLLLCGYGVVSAYFIKSDYLNLSTSITNDIYLSETGLNNNVLIFKSSKDISSYDLYSPCDTESKFLKKKDDYYIFYIKYSANKCIASSVFLKDGKNIILNSKINFNIYSKYSLINKYTDYSTAYLESLFSQLNNLISINKNIKPTSFSTFKKYIKNKSNIYKKNIIGSILQNRKNKYLLPVPGVSLPYSKSKIPNSGRPYREKYTDGIHHGWDFDADKGTQVVAIDDGIIIRVIDGFKFSDLSKMRKKNPISYDDKVYNLNLLRGNQVWLKTSKGDVAFYSHLDSISNELKEGTIIKSGEKIGKVGITGVPDINYNDSHLHFAIQKNPYIYFKAGKYTFDDIQKWDWLTKGLKLNEVLIKQYEIFTK